MRAPSPKSNATFRARLTQEQCADNVTEVGDFVEQDEEIATIETDKVCFLGVIDSERLIISSRSTCP